MKIKTVVRFALVCCSLGFFLSFMIWGEKGLWSQFKMSGEVKLEQKKVAKIEADIEDLQKKISNFKNDDFYKEKMAREELLLGAKNELVYVLN